MFSKAVCSTNILEKIVRNRSYQCVCSQNLEKYKRPMEDCLPQFTLLLAAESTLGSKDD